jgi:chemotaxis protein methyltransferase WspC
VQKIESLLGRTIGLDAASIGRSTIERAVHERSRMCLLPDKDAYWEHLCASATELQQLIETVVVPETWFFRDHGAFAALADTAHGIWLRSRPSATLRMLSLPCSSGEEPYSMSMALIDSGLPPERFRIDAIDVSRRALEKGRQAVYGRNSFRGAQLQFRDRYFEAAGTTYRLAEPVRAAVRFERGNLLDTNFLPGAALYDAIFCRNLLIYFDPCAQTKAIELLARLLKPAGALFVAPAETTLVQSHGFSPMRWPGAFAFRKDEAPPSPAHTETPPASQAKAHITALPRIPFTQQLGQPVAPSVKAEQMVDITRLADQGQLEAAAEACAFHLSTNGPSAQILYLLGLIRDAEGRPIDAIRHYRQTLYLQPAHKEALTQLALLLDKQGDSAAAQLLRARLRRLEPSHA